MNESRKDKSLYTLTKKFVEMLKTEETVDLNIVTNELQCAKKRRIYDVSNVLEGIGLIKKTQKNLYQYTGKTNKNDSILDHEKLSNLKNEKESLESLEKELDKNIYNMEMNNASLRTQDSYLYLTRQDFINAFSKNRSILLLKDYKNIRVIVEDPEATNCSSIHVLGFIVKPVTCKLVNNENSDKPLPTIENLDIDSISNNNNNDIDFVDPKMFDSHKELKKSDDVILFKRSIRPKSFLETDSLEYEKLSENILSHDQYEDKSKFYYVCKNNLVHENDYEKPDFIPLNPPYDSDYHENFSTESPSIHDLFDCDIILDESEHQQQVDITEEMLEEEYIIEELDEESYEMLQ